MKPRIVFGARVEFGSIAGGVRRLRGHRRAQLSTAHLRP
jgi:hypothetical protein